MRSLFLGVSFALFGLGGAVIACSSASPATAADAGTPGNNSTSGDDGTSGTAATSSSSSSSSSGTVVTTDPDAGDAGDAGTTTTTSGGVLTQNSDAGACDTDAFGEQEPNDTAPGNALPVTGTGTFKFCGTAVAGNPDFVSFTVPQFHGIHVSYSGVNPNDVSGTIGNQQWSGNDLPDQINVGDVWTTQILVNNSSRAYQITFEIQ